jgi:hypothetical protein
MNSNCDETNAFYDEDSISLTYWYELIYTKIELIVAQMNIKEFKRA